MKPNPIQTALKSIKEQKNIPASVLTSDLNVAAIMSKLIGDNSTEARRRMMEQYGPDRSTIKSISGKTSSKITDASNFLQMLPDLKLGFEILCSSILSPKDMIESSVTYASECDTLPSEILANLNSIVESFFDKDYKIKTLLPEILKDVLILTGSYVAAVIPENAIDDVINSGRTYTMESFNQILDENCLNSIGLLGKPNYAETKERRSFSFESLLKSQPMTKEDEIIKFNGASTFVRVTDNPNILRTNKLIENFNAVRRNQLLRVSSSLESGGYIDLYTYQNGNNVTDIVTPMYKDPSYRMRPMVTFKTQDQLSRRSAGTPLIQHIPSEAVIPVFSPGSPNEHLGYFVVLDESGHPIQATLNNDYYSQMKDKANGVNNDVMSSLVQRTSLNYDTLDTSNNRHVDELTAAYTEMIEKDLIERLRNGLQGGDVRIANSDSIFRIMLARSLKKQFTQVVYLPKELVTYIALEYNEYGIGKSMIDDMKVLLGLRVITMFSNTMASLRNSIGRTVVNLKLDEEDSDPWKTIEIVMHELNRTRAGVSGTLPIGASGPAEVVEWLANAGFQFTFEGHPGIPDTKIEFSEENTNYVRVDSDLEEDLRKRTCMALGIPPEIIDNAYSPDFATTVVQNNILLSKRVLKIQETLTPLISEHCRKIIANSDSLLASLRGVVEEKIDDIIRRLIRKEEYKALDENTEITDELKRRVVSTVLQDYINAFEIRLPRPNSIELKNLTEAFDTEMEALEKGLDVFIDNNYINSDVSGDLSDKADFIKESVKAMFMRRWMAENNYMTQLFDLVTEDESGHLNLDVYAEFASHAEKLTKAFANVVKHIQPIKDAADKFVEGNNIEESEDSGGSDYGSDSGEDDDTGGDDDFGGGDFDMGDDDMDEDTDEEETEETEEDSTGDEAESDSGDSGEGSQDEDTEEDSGE